MPLWGKTDSAADAPNYVPEEDEDKVFFVDTEESQVAENKAKGLGTPGWNQYNTYTDVNGNTRHRAETLVAMKVASADAGDEGVSANTETEDATVTDPSGE